MTDGNNETPTENREQARQEKADPVNRTRQGVTGHNVRWVLLISLLALLAAYFMIATFFAYE
ncbi:MAG: hypothetical protein JNM45_03715 [Rhizobiales bacterium]|nr:hypothetical protein [Hyphomicrobiales bacterium]